MSNDSCGAGARAARNAAETRLPCELTPPAPPLMTCLQPRRTRPCRNWISGASGGAEGGGQGGVGVLEDCGGDLESFDAPEFDVLVFDVDQQPGVDVVERAQELGPEVDVVPLAQSDD